ncbi:MAG: signal peptide peptidase SppA [Deltaproteobacteria bacterium]|nr:MAG: signal peptide peptidase SppA [Deltaproteobacteria bacterium]HDG98696.1 signal peptide peptidase SppA [Desulfobacterales bacterium]
MPQKKRTFFTVVLILLIVGLVLGLASILIIKQIGESPKIAFGDKIGVITIEGPITNSRAIINQLVEFKKDKGIKAIILRIDSPGGGVGPSQEIYREVMRTRTRKKVIASMGAVAASGGYYVASAADRIVANPGTLTGSIGVIMEFVQIKELLKKIGVSMEVIKSGEFKDIGSPHRKLTEKEKRLLQDLIGDIQDQFVNAVAKGRNLPVEKVKKIADGRILSGEQAKKLGLVDQLGNFQDAVELAKKIAGIKGEARLIYPSRKKVGLWDIIFNSAARSILRLLKNTNGEVKYYWPGPLNSSLTETY